MGSVSGKSIIVRRCAFGIALSFALSLLFLGPLGELETRVASSAETRIYRVDPRRAPCRKSVNPRARGGEGASFARGRTGAGESNRGFNRDTLVARLSHSTVH